MISRDDQPLRRIVKLHSYSMGGIGISAYGWRCMVDLDCGHTISRPASRAERRKQFRCYECSKRSSS